MIRLKRRKLKITFFYNEEGSFSYSNILPILGQYNIRDTSLVLKSILELLPFNYLKRPSKIGSFSFSLYLAFHFFTNADTKINIKYPNINYFVKNLIFKKRKKEIFFKIEIFKLMLITNSNHLFNLENRFSFLHFTNIIGTSFGLNLSFKNHFYFKSRKINFRRKKLVEGEA